MTACERLLSVLDLFDVDCPDWSVDEAAAALGLATSTAYRYFASLTGTGLLAPFAVGRYVLGPTIIRYDRSLRLTDPLIAAAGAELRALAELAPGRTVALLCRLFGGQVMCVDQACVGQPSFSYRYERGRPMPLYLGSASKVILAHLPTRLAKRLFAQDPAGFDRGRLGKTWEEVRSSLRSIRTSGLFVSSGELDREMRAVSVPLVVDGGSLLASLTVVGPQAVFTPDLIDQLSIALRGAGPRVVASVKLGGPVGADRAGPLSPGSASDDRCARKRKAVRTHDSR